MKIMIGIKVGFANIYPEAHDKLFSLIDQKEFRYDLPQQYIFSLQARVRYG